MRSCAEVINAWARPVTVANGHAGGQGSPRGIYKSRFLGVYYGFVSHKKIRVL